MYFSKKSRHIIKFKSKSIILLRSKTSAKKNEMPKIFEKIPLILNQHKFFYLNANKKK